MNRTVRATHRKVLIGVGVLALASVALFGTARAATSSEKQVARPTDAMHQAIDAALAQNDYAAFKSATAAVTKPKDAPEITEATFAKMAEAYKLRQSGDNAGAQKIMESIGFKQPPHGPGFENGKHGFFQNLTDAQKQAFEQARALHEAGNDTEAKAVLTAAGIPTPPGSGKFHHGRPITSQPSSTSQS